VRFIGQARLSDGLGRGDGTIPLLVCAPDTSGTGLLDDRRACFTGHLVLRARPAGTPNRADDFASLHKWIPPREAMIPSSVRI